MNLVKPLRSAARLLHVLFLKARYGLPRQRCHTFTAVSEGAKQGVGPVYVINLDRQTRRWADMTRELGRIVDSDGRPISDRVVRYSAIDAQGDLSKLSGNLDVNPFYTLADQLFVEPQPDAVPDAFDLERPIEMSQAEIAVARSHIGVWRAIAESGFSYSLVLEDDVWFEPAFGRWLDRAWDEMEAADTRSAFDILYLSYKEVRHGAPKELLSGSVFRPERGLWYLSGYVLSNTGARALLDHLPCHGPVDLWINLKFRDLEVRALRRPVIHQRRDLSSSNSYSILPALSRIGVLDGGDASLFHRNTVRSPVFAFGEQGSGLTSLAMALSMLGYRCCNDLDNIPEGEFERLLSGDKDRVFDAYVNIGSLEEKVDALRRRYPEASFIVISDEASTGAKGNGNAILASYEGARVLVFSRDWERNWRALCEHLKLAPPDAQFPTSSDIGFRKLTRAVPGTYPLPPAKRLRNDPSPWVAKPLAGWNGIFTEPYDEDLSSVAERVCFEDNFSQVRRDRWLLRNDTFPGNLALFRPANIASSVNGSLSLTVAEEKLGVRGFSAAAISTDRDFLFGRFEATLQATDVPGLVTGFFLHRDSPRQEIDVEILGNRPDQLLVNVFYNPGGDGAKFDYGYRGTPSIIELGFDASKALHHFAIDWKPSQIDWYVDERLVHRRGIWGPTPIPHLPMKLHLNNWPTRSRRLAGRLVSRRLPASAHLGSVTVDANSLRRPDNPTASTTTDGAMWLVSAD